MVSEGAADPCGEYADYFYLESGAERRCTQHYRSYFEEASGSRFRTDLYHSHLFAKEQSI